MLPHHLHETQTILRMQKSFGVYRFVRATSDYALEIKFPILLCLHLITNRFGFTISLELLLTELFRRLVTIQRYTTLAVLLWCKA